jgi:hypothetical protein
MQSGNLAVMGYCDREGMDKHWGAGLAEAGVESDTDPLASMRAMTAQQIVSNPSFNVSQSVTSANLVAGWLQSLFGRRLHHGASDITRRPIESPTSRYRRGPPWRQCA